jgi:hypothetical protein
MNYECGCYYGPEDALEPCCPIHQMPMKLGDALDDDMNWAVSELRRFGHINSEED